jgi:hypothetical protein
MMVGGQLFVTMLCFSYNLKTLILQHSRCMTDQYSLHLQGHIHIYPMNYNLFCIDMQLEKYSTQSMLEILIASHLHSLVPDNRTCLLIDRVELVGLRKKQKQPSNIGGLIFLSSPCQIQT